MGFHEVRLPMRLALGASGGPEWRTDLTTLASGHEVRNELWSRGRRRWEIGSALTDLASLQDLVSFFDARGGRLNGFRFSDPLDHSSAPPGEAIGFEDQTIGIGDGETVQFQLTKTTDGVSRRITKPVAETVVVGLDGVQQDTGWSLDGSTGLVTFETAPVTSSTVTAGFAFDVPVRFDTDRIQAMIEAFGAGRVATLGLVELFEAAS
ncbi:MAG: DUF2460 domain-containing protein [Pseudomonadota bacterium]